MANNYYQATVTPELPAELFSEEDLTSLNTACGLTTQREGGSLYFFAEESFCERGEDEDGFGVDCLALFQEKLLRLDSAEYPHIAIEGAATCSKMRPGEFGGFAYLITRDAIRSYTTWQWLREHIDVPPIPAAPAPVAAHAPAVGSPDALTMRLFQALEGVLPYARNDSQSLHECSQAYGEADIQELSRECDEAIDEGEAAVTAARSAFPSLMQTPGPTPRLAPESGIEHPSEGLPRFHYEHDPVKHPDRAHVRVDGKFDIAIVRTDEGVAVDVYAKDGQETVATTYAFDSDLGDPEIQP
jgi:hypothetical protein